MGLRLNSLQTRTALAVVSVIVVSLTLNGVYLILGQRAEARARIEGNARTFAELTKAPISTAYNDFYDSGFFKFRELIRERMHLNRDVKRILIVNMQGEVVFDSDEMDDAISRPAPVARRIEELERLKAIKQLDSTVLKMTWPTGEPGLEIIAPYLEEWGRHELSVIYQVNPGEGMREAVTELLIPTGAFTLASVLAAVGVAIMLARRITRPVAELTAGAQELAEGHFERRLNIRSGDELQILAEAFNHMTTRLKENVDELEESNKKLGGVNEELKELDRMKSDLLANVSHELRTPLTAIKGYTDYILERKLGDITDKQEKGLVVVQRNLERLSRTIGALLDFSRMDIGRITLNLQRFSVASLIEQIHTTVRSELDKKKLRFVTAVEGDLPSLIADREKLSAVIENLVINAIKFTPEGGSITVSAGRVAGAERPTAEIRVSDSGIGIPRDQIDKIFNRFHQVDGTTTRRFGGVGLGLAIVKSILDAHGAVIQVESEEGKGTVFHFRLPLLERAEDHSDQAPSPKDRTEEGVVLVVDDDVELIKRVSADLMQEGLAVLTASSAEEGAALAAARHPDVILLDILLPDRSGLELLASLKREPATRHIPVLIVSVLKEEIKALALGAAEHLVKPVDRATLAASVRRVLANHPEAEPTVLVVDDDLDTAELVRDTLRVEGFRTVVAHDGRQALDAMERRHPALVILDLMMPELSGFEVLEAIGRGGRTPVPVLILSGRGEDDDVRRCLEMGARKYMSKPFDVRELMSEVRRHLGTSGRAQQASL
jgi:signal transduction histidine kinase/DNA-binding response OmpR family regulator